MKKKLTLNILFLICWKQRPPYRDSELTRLLQPYFTGGKVSMIVTLSSSAADYGETKSSLEFSAIASQISIAKENQAPRVNGNAIDISQVQALLKEKEQQLRILMATEMETNLREQSDSYQRQLDESKIEIESFVTKKLTRKIESERIHFGKILRSIYKTFFKFVFFFVLNFFFCRKGNFDFEKGNCNIEP